MPIRDALARALKRYPALARYGDRYQMQDGDRLEYYPQGERDSPNPSARVIQAPRNTSPEDVAGEMVSHDLVQGVDPALTSSYREFERGMTGDQRRRLTEQYQWAQGRGEERPFEQWRKYSGQPAYYRGDLFNQWDHPEEFYTDGQRAMFDKMRRRLSVR